MDEIEGVRLQPGLEQVIDDELYVGDPFSLQKRSSDVELALVDVAAHDPARGPDPLAEDPQPAQRSAADVQGACAGCVLELCEEVPPGGLPNERLEPQALQLRRLVGQQVILRHGRSIPYPRCSSNAFRACAYFEPRRP